MNANRTMGLIWAAFSLAALGAAAQTNEITGAMGFTLGQPVQPKPGMTVRRDWVVASTPGRTFQSVTAERLIDGRVYRIRCALRPGLDLDEVRSGLRAKYGEPRHELGSDEYGFGSGTNRIVFRWPQQGGASVEYVSVPLSAEAEAAAKARNAKASERIGHDL